MAPELTHHLTLLGHRYQINRHTFIQTGYPNGLSKRAAHHTPGPGTWWWPQHGRKQKRKRPCYSQGANMPNVRRPNCAGGGWGYWHQPTQASPIMRPRPPTLTHDTCSPSLCHSHQRRQASNRRVHVVQVELRLARPTICDPEEQTGQRSMSEHAGQWAHGWGQCHGVGR